MYFKTNKSLKRDKKIWEKKLEKRVKLDQISVKKVHI